MEMFKSIDIRGLSFFNAMQLASQEFGSIKKNGILELIVDKKRNITIICLAGYMKILNKRFINGFKKKIINIHPSLLPKYKGLNTFQRALKNNDKFTGCTVHYVNNKLDSGKIILKKRIIIEKNDNEETLKAKIQAKEHKAYSESIINIFK